MTSTSARMPVAARNLLALLVLAILAAACGDPVEGAADVTSEPDGATISAPSEAEPTEEPESATEEPDQAPTKDPVAPPVATATATATDTATPATDAAAAPVAPPATGDVTDLPSLNAAIIAAIGRPDVSVALSELGPFPADLAFPDDAVLAEVTLEETDLRILTGDPDAIRPLSNRVGGVAITLLKIEEAQPQIESALSAIGFDLSTSGITATTQGDGTEVRTGFFTRGGDDESQRENMSLTLVARPGTDHLQMDVDYTLDRDAEGLSAPITRWITGYPILEGYQLQSARVSTFYFGSPSFDYSATISGPDGQIDVAMEQVMAALPAGGFELGSDTTIGGDPELRYVDLVAPGVGEGETAVSESSGTTNIRPTIRVEFPLHPSLEPWLIG